VVICRPDAKGRLRVAWRAGRRLEAGRRRSARRLEAFRTRTVVRLGATASGRSLAIVPLVAGDESVAVMEMDAPAHAITHAWTTLMELAHHGARALRTEDERRVLRREVDVLERAAHLGRDLVRARSSESAIRVAVRFVAERLEVPAAGWCEGPDGSLTLVAVAGLGDRRRREIRRHLTTLPPLASFTAEERQEVERRVAALAGVSGVFTLDAGGGVLMAGRPTQGVGASLEVIGAMLAEVLRLRSIATLAERRIERLDMGIAWTAHELRGPLLGVRAVLELMLQRERDGSPERETLRRSLSELDRLAGTAESLLAWAVGARPLELRRADVVRVVEEAVETCRVETGDDRVVVSAPHHAVARVDAGTMRTALVNIVRNALAHASPGTKVEVEVERDGKRVLVGVRDHGPTIPVTERETIFDPFVRGSAENGGRHGSGLGLFIARRIVEAHEGSIWVGSDRGETTFLVALPVEQEGARRVAS
jgi:signal transduction histidine kinase